MKSKWFINVPKDKQISMCQDWNVKNGHFLWSRSVVSHSELECWQEDRLHCSSSSWKCVFSYASSSTLYPCQWVSKWVSGWAEFRTSVASRLASLLLLNLVLAIRKLLTFQTWYSRFPYYVNVVKLSIQITLYQIPHTRKERAEKLKSLPHYWPEMGIGWTGLRLGWISGQGEV